MIKKFRKEVAAMKDSENEYGFDDLSRETSEEAVYALAASFRDVDRDDERPDEAEFTEKIAAELAAEQPILETPVPPPEPEPKNEAEKKRRALKKKLREEALERMENAARTLPEYNEVIHGSGIIWTKTGSAENEIMSCCAAMFPWNTA